MRGAKAPKPAATRTEIAVTRTGIAVTRTGIAGLAGVATLGIVAGAIRRAIVRRRSRRRSRRAGRDVGRWHSVTVNRRPQDVSATVGPAPLEQLGLEVEIRYRPAPGGRGTEVAVRAAHDGMAQQRKIRSALRQAKQLWETGEVLQADGPATEQRTVWNRPLAYATRHARQDGRL
jgi:hypothetical protein